ncbi:HEAT repeat-containing protein 1-like, partial [Amphibalanus amphitrite]|uniref:HEAT repeat-containing protein 1-like n=1 Tax=Amphibalanus amphitrite TaxID=1232801 RepID=UPI001C901A1B
SAALDAAGAAAARQRHQQLLEGAIRLMGVCSRLCHSALAGRPQATRHLRAILHRLYDLLDKVNALLPWATLLPVVSALMASDLAAVRRRAMDLLASRLQLQHDGFSESDVPALLAITDELVAAAGAESEDGSALSRQTALFAVKLLSRRLSADQPRHFVQVLGAVCSLAAGGQLPAPLLASVLLCLAELVAGLRAHAVGRLPAVAAVLLAALSDSDRL